MTLRDVSRALLLGLVLALVATQSASAAVRHVGEATNKYFLCDADASHPKKVQVYQTIEGDYGAATSLYLIADYGRDYARDAGPSNATVTTKIHVLRDGKWRKVGRLRAGLFNEGTEGSAEIGKWFTVSLEPGDRLRWTFAFKQFEPMLTGEFFSVAGEVIAELP